MQAVVLHCINTILTGEVTPPRLCQWLGGMVRFLLKKEELALDTTGYSPVCLLDTTYKLLSAIITDRLYRLSERYGLLDPSQEGIRRLRSTQRQVQSLHWALQEAAERRETVFCCYLDFANAFNSVDNQALWRWLRETGSLMWICLRASTQKHTTKQTYRTDGQRLLHSRGGRRRGTNRPLCSSTSSSTPSSGR